MYFPTIGSNQWETISPEELNWNSDEIKNLYEFLELNNTRAFIVLKDGKIVIEKYWVITFLIQLLLTETPIGIGLLQGRHSLPLWSGSHKTMGICLLRTVVPNILAMDGPV